MVPGTSYLTRPLPETLARARRAAVATAVLGLLIVLPLRRIASTDLWWHLKCGQTMVAERALVRSDTLSFTTAGAAWTDGAWLWDLGAYLGYTLWPSDDFLVLAGWGLVLATFVLALAPLRGDAFLAAALCLPWVIRISRGRFLLQPDLVTSLFAVVMVLAFLAEDKRQRRWLWVLVPLEALWANLHGSYPLGLALLALHAVGRALERRPSRAPLVVLAAAATLVTPYAREVFWRSLGAAGSAWNRVLEAVGLAARAADGGQTSLYILEWMPTLSALGRTRFPLGAYLAYALVGFLSFALVWRTVRPWRALVYLALFLLSLTAVRMLYPFALATLPLVALNLAETVRLRTWLRAAPGLALSAMVVGTSFAGVAVLSRPPDDGFGFGVASKYFPVAALNFLDQQGLGGRIFAPYHTGGYIAWKSQLERTTFIDGRLVSWAVYKEYEDAFAHPEGFDALASRYGFDVVLLSLRPDQPQALRERLEASPSWAKIYADSDFVVYLRETSAHESWLRRFAVRHGGRLAGPCDTIGLNLKLHD